jgi:outer membrane protein assembly factor BamB
LIDVDSDMLLSNDKLYVASYQGQLAALEIADKPTPLWQLPVSSFQSLAQGLGNVYDVDAGSTIIAVDQVSGKVVWKQSDFAWRGLSNAVSLGDYLIVGDNKGYIHLMAQSNGKLLGRKKVSDAVIQLSVNQRALMVYTAKGQWSRWQLPVL